ncbi:putative glutamate receptor [Mytilus galloprovincialis]|uniref:putative glutamate receptor n=1 Tax=Mytilus galloprovincialis TaxID=29158 RepID=UPI003F7C6498
MTRISASLQSKNVCVNNVTNCSSAISLISLIAHLKWSSVCIIFDKESGQQAFELHHGLSTYGILAVIYPMEEVTSSQIDALSSSSQDKSTNINFTVLCQHVCLQFLEKPFEFGRKNVWRNSLLHLSRWLVGVDNVADLLDFEMADIKFDNVAVVKNYTTNKKEINNLTSTDQDESNQEGCTHQQIYTLMWQSSRRNLSPVLYTNQQLPEENKLFPNANFGFNKRKFLVNTLPFSPFVQFNNETDQYTGITIEILNQLSRDLNFTYEIQPPPDGNWGAEKYNGSWNGMVGQLQQREVDIVAAALTVHSDRETVMDFTYPYFYEFSSIIFKKSDPDNSKWTRLLDPLSTTVLILVGICLPTASFILCLLENTNPFYNKRQGKRGLHNMSDSFWYMYGALLTQGGEHMAASSSGRTLLSCWWIFCIIMAATYSANFVAFLTVRKNKPPFDDIKGLIAQDEYKWGIAGDSIYESIFKDSNLPDRKLFWKGIVAFNKTDPSVLNSETKSHIEKMLSEKYAFIDDHTGTAKLVANNCQVTLLPTDIMSTYAIGLPNNSPFVEKFSNGIMTVLESGHVSKWRTNYWPYTSHCAEESKTEAKAIKIIDLQIAFYLIGIGILLSLMFLICEYITIKCRQLLEKKGIITHPDNPVRHIKTISMTDHAVHDY